MKTAKLAELMADIKRRADMCATQGIAAYKDEDYLKEQYYNGAEAAYLTIYNLLIKEA